MCLLVCFTYECTILHVLHFAESLVIFVEETSLMCKQCSLKVHNYNHVHCTALDTAWFC